MPIIQAIAQVERPQPQPQPRPRPKPKLPATVNVAAVLAKLKESSSTLDLVGDGNISAVVQSAGKVLYEKLVVNLGVGDFQHLRFKPIYCQVYKQPATASSPERRALVVSPIPIVSKLAFGRCCDRNNFVSICRERSPPG
ncbi:MAG: hypothetical protein F6K54_24340 [Okeania sp. SIO3B5]|uniref:hypothetical protein n=1 Tax=Okeania sp. SIO3B5 TaxID=2607811 RepID=UPI0013FFD201|nr:hypothetical protein [Okeania sp. SIO3B5]NEO55920.1 hypothetical protein [Okeania sp. SIO3B5]